MPRGIYNGKGLKKQFIDYYKRCFKVIKISELFGSNFSIVPRTIKDFKIRGNVLAKIKSG